MTKYRGIKKLSGQGKSYKYVQKLSSAMHVHIHYNTIQFFITGVEKLNDDCRRIHLERSNKWDAPKDILLVGKRLERLSAYERTPRQYRKRETDYWQNDIRETRAKRTRICIQLPDDSFVADNLIVEDMISEEIKTKLKETGITTRLRSLKKLQELLIKTLRNEQHQTELVS